MNLSKSCKIKPEPNSVSESQNTDLDNIIDQSNINSQYDHDVVEDSGPCGCENPEKIPTPPSDLIVQDAGKYKKSINFIGIFNNLRNNIKANSFLEAAKIFGKKINKKFKMDDDKKKNKHTFLIVNSQNKLGKKYEIVNQKIKHNIYTYKHTINEISNKN